jgi:outer membrane protein OmpA-like peptidoglycan-associated protein
MEIFIVITLAFAVLLSTSSETKVVLLPSEKENTQIIVNNQSGSQVVDKVGDAITVDSQTNNPSAPKAVDVEKIKSMHSSLFASQPQKADTFLLYFENGSDKLLNESQLLITTIIQSANDRNAPIINIIGHSDAAGSAEYNLKLSFERANAVAQLLQSANIKDAEYRIDSYGENDPLIKSGKEIEPKNRRVEVEIW